jgi:hypothetical protein
VSGLNPAVTTPEPVAARNCRREIVRPVLIPFSASLYSVCETPSFHVQYMVAAAWNGRKILAPNPG